MLSLELSISQYIIMPSGIGEAPTTRLVPMDEELADGEIIHHKWPVTPFEIMLVNSSSRPCFVDMVSFSASVS
jgi:hypothetical protein